MKGCLRPWSHKQIRAMRLSEPPRRLAPLPPRLLDLPFLLLTRERCRLAPLREEESHQAFTVDGLFPGFLYLLFLYLYSPVFASRQRT